MADRMLMLLQITMIISTAGAMMICVLNLKEDHSRPFSGISIAAFLIGCAMTTRVLISGNDAPFPTRTFLILAFLYLISVIAELAMVGHLLKNRLGNDSVKAAFNAMDVGLCCYDGLGQVVLCNECMQEISRALTGTRVRNGREFRRTLASVRLTDAAAEGWQIAAGGRRFSVAVQHITLRGLELTELKCTDVSELCEKTKMLAEKTESLKEINSHLLRYAEIADQVIREQEILDAKISVHDRFGELLLRLRNALENDDSEEHAAEIAGHLAETLRSILQDRPDPGDDFEGLKRIAKSIGVTLDLPQIPETMDSGSRELIRIAVRESLSNAVRHADATEVRVTLTDSGEQGPVLEIRNDGRRPAGPITPGTGLSALKSKAARAGKTVEILWDPEFVLRVKS